ncbi:restriction endonuclease subunit S (plasmid) [Acetobacter sp. AC2005]|uniref:restriction endonuclease subunit S n=1 Tax=Acetobacter sp. AC2005 TaxID=3134142 RepID=UPI0030D37127
MLPEGWKSEKLGDLCTLNPKCPHIQSASLTSFISMDGVSNDAKISRVTLHHFKKEKNGFSYFQEHDILVAKITPCFENGKGGYLDKLPTSHGFGSTEFHVLRPSPNADGKFIYYITTSERFRTLGEMNMQGSAGQKRVPKNFIERFSIATPPLPEQKKIAAILSTWDRAIEGTEKLLANSQQQKKALMQQLLTGKKRLPGFTGAWKKKTLSNFCQIKTGKKDVNEGCENGKYPFFTCAKQHTFSNNYSYECEAILIAGNGEVGKTHYYNGKFEAYQRTYILSDFTNISVFFLLHFIEFFLPLDISKEKQHGAMPYIKLGTLKDFSVLTPPLPEQEVIATVLSTADEEIAAIESDLSRLRQEKKALMQQLLTGKRRVKVD